MNTTNAGKEAEGAVCEYLEAKGFIIVDRNFRTSRCEIDIIARHAACLYFVEVKYRASLRQGSGLEYITSNKQKQMRFAAEIWMRGQNWQGEPLLSPVEVTGSNYTGNEFI